MESNSNWRELPAGKELDRLIAAELGYSEFSTSQSSRLLWGWRQAREDDNEWHIEDGRINEPIPDYSTDVDAALYHLKIEGFRIALLETNYGYHAFYHTSMNLPMPDGNVALDL